MNNILVRILAPFLPRRYWYRRFYLRSRHWQSRRKQALRRAGYRCSECRRPATDVHHLKYYEGGRSVLWREKERHLTALCRKCHERKHE